MERRELYFWTALIAVTNVMVRYVFASIGMYGLIGSVAATFNISIIVWIALIWPFIMMSSASKGSVVGAEINRFDALICSLAILISLAPIEYVGWLAVFIIGLGAYSNSENDSQLRNAGIVLCALTVPQFWAKIIFTFTSKYILIADSMLVSLFTGTYRTGNIVKMPNFEGYLQISGPCSSFANISLGFLGWLLVVLYYERRFSLRLYGYGLLVSFLVVLVNTSRISLIAYFPSQFHLLHDGIGSTVIGWIYVFVILGVAIYAVQSEPTHSHLASTTPLGRGPSGVSSRQNRHSSVGGGIR